jgi:hypothetical protein
MGWFGEGFAAWVVVRWHREGESWRGGCFILSVRDICPVLRWLGLPRRICSDGLPWSEVREFASRS